MPIYVFFAFCQISRLKGQRLFSDSRALKPILEHQTFWFRVENYMRYGQLKFSCPLHFDLIIKSWSRSRTPLWHFFTSPIEGYFYPKLVRFPAPWAYFITYTHTPIHTRTYHPITMRAMYSACCKKSWYVQFNWYVQCYDMICSTQPSCHKIVMCLTKQQHWTAP